MSENMYQSLDRIKRRISKSFKPKSYFHEDEENQFDLLLEDLEEESSGMIESYKGDVSFIREERVTTIPARDSTRIPLIFPIQSIKSVEWRNNSQQDWRELNERRYYHTKHALVLEHSIKSDRMSRSRGVFRGRNPLKDNTMRSTWRDVARHLKITYTAGYEKENIPPDVLSIQIDIITNMLNDLRGDQSKFPASAQEISDRVSGKEIMTDDIRRRLDEVTRHYGSVGAW